MQLFTVDVFTDKPFSGNPAGVCAMEAPLDPAQMQRIASELNLAETAFLYPISESPLFTEGQGGWHLRWFTPAVEINLCGHATIAATHILEQTGRIAPDSLVHYQTKSGALTARRVGDKFELNFPAVRVESRPLSAEAMRALGVTRVSFSTGGNWQLAELETEDRVRMLRPDVRALYSLGIGNLIVTARASTAPFDFVMRVFVPAFGIDEDPATGAAHCVLAPYWSAKLKRSPLLAWQLSKRGGFAECEPHGDRVLIRGAAVTMLSAELNV
ncbi:PhzF family phenazine biosynthesis protein [candidate division KSB1 bacterium]|nr:PhzF family phenazine biosynthesis protein [candidate division KSB1 bacterium]